MSNEAKDSPRTRMADGKVVYDDPRQTAAPKPLAALTAMAEKWESIADSADCYAQSAAKINEKAMELAAQHHRTTAKTVRKCKTELLALLPALQAECAAMQERLKDREEELNLVSRAAAHRAQLVSDPEQRRRAQEEGK